MTRKTKPNCSFHSAIPKAFGFEAATRLVEKTKPMPAFGRKLEARISKHVLSEVEWIRNNDIF